MLTNLAFVFICVRASSALVRTSAFLQPVVRGQVYNFEILPPLLINSPRHSWIMALELSKNWISGICSPSRICACFILVVILSEEPLFYLRLIQYFCYFQPKLVTLMGKDKFDLYAGKIWQLKFCEDMARIGIPS